MLAIGSLDDTCFMHGRRDGSLGELEKAHPPIPDDELAPGTHAGLLQRMMSSMIASGPGHLQLSKSKLEASTFSTSFVSFATTPTSTR